MKVKVGNQVYDSKDQPIMVILSEDDKRNIANMLPDAHQYAEFPENLDEDQVRAWMAET